MRLSFEETKKLTVGAVKLWEDADGFHFLSVTDEQLRAFEKRNDALRRNAAATTGIRIDFETNSSYIAFSALTTNRYELKVDGIQTAIADVTARERNLFELPSDGKLHRVTLHLPSHGESGAIEYVELSDGAEVIPHAFDMKILFIGDSITQGYNSKYDTLSYAYQVSDHFNADSIIQGTGGSCFYTDTLVPLDFDPDKVIVAYGTNDANKFDDLSEIEKNCKEFLTKLKELYNNSKIYVITPIWRIKYDVPKPYGHISQVADIVKRVSESLELCVIDGLRMIPADPFFMADDLHPNDLGFSVYAHNLIKELQ